MNLLPGVILAVTLAVITNVIAIGSLIEELRR